MTSHSVVSTDEAPQNDNPYSQGILADDLLFVSGQGPTDPASMETVDGDIGTQTRQTLRNIEGVLRAADATLQAVTKVTVYLDDMDDYGDMNESYATVFGDSEPARVCVEVARLPGDIAIEIDAIAHLNH